MAEHRYPAWQTVVHKGGFVENAPSVGERPPTQYVGNVKSTNPHPTLQVVLEADVDGFIASLKKAQREIRKTAQAMRELQKLREAVNAE